MLQQENSSNVLRQSRCKHAAASDGGDAPAGSDFPPRRPSLRASAASRAGCTLM